MELRSALSALPTFFVRQPLLPACLFLAFAAFAVPQAAADCPDITDPSGPYFAHRCDRCHGEDGLGRGNWNRGIPRGEARSFVAGNFVVATCDASMKDVIRQGGAKFGLSPLMPPHEGISDEDLDCIIKVIRDFNKE